MPYRKMLKPARQPDESREAYLERRALMDRSVEQYLRGHRSNQTAQPDPFRQAAARALQEPST